MQKELKRYLLKNIIVKIRNVIVGLDPGTTVGIAVLSLSGNVLDVFSKRNAKKSEVIKEILKYGRPLIIATDKSSIPKSVEQIASQFGSRIYFPPHEMKISEKETLTKQFSSKIKNDHERDALAAALKAWKKYKDEIFSTYEFLKKIGIDEEYLDENLFLFLSRRKIERKSEKMQQSRKLKVKDNVSNYYETLKNLKDKIEFLRDSLNEAKKEAKFYKELLLKLVKNFRIRDEKSKEYNILLKKINKALLKGFVPLVEIDDLNLENLEIFNEMIGLENQVIYTADKEKLSNLNSFKISAVILKSSSTPSSTIFLNFPVISESEIKIKEKFGLKVVERNEFERKLNEAKKWHIRELIENYKRRK